MKEFGVIILGLFALSITVFALNGLGFLNYKFFAPKIEQVKREVYTNTPSYVLGNVRDLENLRLEYLSSNDEDHKLLLADTIRHRALSIDADDLPNDLRFFINKLKNGVSQ